jgi:hypothetical protein
LPFNDKTLQKNDLVSIFKNTGLIEEAIYKAMETEFFKTSVVIDKNLNGRNFIIFKILKKYVSKIIETDSQTVPLNILGLEHNLTHSFEISTPEGNLKIRIGGNIDRIDKDKNGIRIIDYKTGKVEQKFSGLEELFIAREGKKLKKEIFQTLLYAILYKDTSQPETYVSPNLFSLRNIFGDDFDSGIYFGKSVISDITLVETEFKNQLTLLLAEIYNPNLSFTQTKDFKRCENCTYRIICHR